jgi:DnaJ-class molecular chaperone
LACYLSGMSRENDAVERGKPFGKRKEQICPDCNGTGYPTLKQPAHPARRIYPPKCERCGGKGRVEVIN